MGTNKFVLIPLFCSIFIQLLTFHDFLLHIPAAQFCQEASVSLAAPCHSKSKLLSQIQNQIQKSPNIPSESFLFRKFLLCQQISGNWIENW